MYTDSATSNTWRFRSVIVGVLLLCAVGVGTLTWRGLSESKPRVANFSKTMTIGADAFDPAEGMLVKGPARPHVYQVFGGRKHWIPNPATFNNLYTTWAAIRVVPTSSVNVIPTGPPYSNGARLVRCPGFAHIFLQTNRQKRWICDPSSYNQYHFAWNKVKSLTLAQCKSICNGPIICNSAASAVRQPYYGQLAAMGATCRGKPADGTLFKCISHAVYQQIDGEKQHIPNPATFNRLYGLQGWKKIVTYPNGYCSQVESGAALSSNAALIQCLGYAHIFLHSNAQKRWICNPRAYLAYFYRFGTVHRQSVQQCKKICVGHPLCLTMRAELRQPYYCQMLALEPSTGCEHV